MSVQSVKAYLAPLGEDGHVLEFSASSATVSEAAQALRALQPERFSFVENGHIAKTLSFSDGAAGCFLLVAAGDVSVDNHKFKETFHRKARMLPPDEVEALTGHPVGGVCPFALPKKVEVYLDLSLRRFETVFPACGSAHSAIPLTPERLFVLSRAKAWVDVTKAMGTPRETEAC